MLCYPTKNLFNFSDNQRLRGHNYKIIKQRVNKSKFANFFTNWVVNRWNELPCSVVNAKKSIDNYNFFDEHNKDIQFKIDINKD